MTAKIQTKNGEVCIKDFVCAQMYPDYVAAELFLVVITKTERTKIPAKDVTGFCISETGEYNPIL